jgi:predicted phage terminase large subunit-like protein
MKFDDLIGESEFNSPTEMAAAIQWLKHSVSLLVSLRDGEIHMIGTRWSMEDIYSFAMEKMQFETFIRKAIVRGPNGPEPFFPEMVSLDNLRDIIETDPFHWATQYANDPYDTADADFQSGWLRYYRIAPDGNIRYTDSDGSTAIQEVHKLRVYAHVDPSMGETASADSSAVVVVGVAPNGNIFILDVWKKRIDPLGLIDKIFQVHSLWAPRLISIESVGYQRSLKYYVEAEAKRRGTYLRIEPYHPGTRRNKEARIRQTLQPYFSTGAIFLQGEQFELVDEYLAFPRKHPDVLDALAQGPEYWKTPEDDQRLERFKRLQRSYEEQATGVTGYGI